MRAVLLSSALFAILVNLAAGGTLPQVSFQPHSYDDLRLWPQLFAKGARMVKVDPNFQTAAICAGQVNANRSDPRGCFLLKHDDPVAGDERPDYNTTEQMLALLGSEWARPYLTQPDTFYIALCFKNGGDCTTPHWTDLVTELFLAANALVTKLNLNLEFVLDGAGAPVGCLVDMWRPWVSTWTQAPGPAFTSNNSTLGYDRFQIMNPEALEFYIDVLEGYGKFPATSYPYQVWEPSDQATIQSLLDTYINSKSTHPLRFAINIDIAQFQVYAANRTGTAWNEAITTQAGLTSPQVTVIPNVALSNGSTTTAVVIVSTNTAAGNASVYSVSAFDAYLGPLTLAVPTGPLAGNPAIISPTAVSSVTLSTGQAFVIVSGTVAGGNGKLSVSLLSVDPSTLELTPVSFLSTILDGSGTPLGAGGGAVVIPNTVCKSGAMVMGTSPSTPAALCLAVAGVTSAGITVGLYTGSGILLSPSSSLVVSSVAFSTASLAAFATKVDSSTVAVSGVVELPSSSSTGISSVPFCLTVTSSGPTASCINCVTQEYTCGPVSTARAPHPGNAASVSLITTPSRNYILRVWGDGFCPNSEIHNKQASSGACDNAAVSTPNVLNYQFGEFSRWLVETGPPYVCSPDVMYGAFNQGAGLPTGSLFSTSSSPNVGLVIAHAALPAGSVDWGSCGPPTTGTGLILDAWTPPINTMFP